MALLMGIDLGTSSLKTIVINEAGKVMAESARAYDLESPHNGYAEQNPETWWLACVESIKEVLLVCKADEIAGISFSGQMHGLVALDKAHKPVRPAILHCDARASKEVDVLNQLFTYEEVTQWMLNPIYTGFLLPSLMWMKVNEPLNFEKTAYVCLPKDYIKMKLTGELSSDYSDASATLAFDIERQMWSDSIIDRVGFEKTIFPHCIGTTANAGYVSKEAAQATGLKMKTTVVAGGGDQVMQGIGNGTSGLNKATVNIGSSGQVCFQTDQAVHNPKLSSNSFCGYKEGRWILFGATMTAGLSLSWWNKIAENHDYQMMNKAIEGLPAGSGGLIYLPYLNGERTPHVDPNLSGMFAGLNIRTTKQHMTRAVMEGVAYSLKECMDVCADLGYRASVLVASGGGAKSAVWRQIQSDIFGLPVMVAKIQEQAGLGAAIAAGVGSGIYKDIEEGCGLVVKYHDEITQPNIENHKVYKDYYAQYKQLVVASKDVIHNITGLGR